MKMTQIPKMTWLCGALLALSFVETQAADVVKADNATNLNDPAAWLGGATPTAVDVAVWNSTVTSANTTLLGADTNWAGIRIANPADAVTISAGNTLTNGASGIDMSAATTNLTIGAGLSLGAAQTWNVAADRTLTVSGVVSATNRITKEGAGTVVLSGANNYSGGTVNNAGVLQINSGTGVGATGGLTNNNGSTVRINTTTSIANPVNWNGTVTLDLNNFANNEALTGNWSGSGTVNMTNQNSAAVRIFTAGGSSANWSGFTGTINMGTNIGTLRLNDGGSSGNTGNSLATVDLGTTTGSFLTRNRLAPVSLGVLLGGPGTRVLNGTSSSGTSTYSIGGKDVPFTFEGAFVDATAVTAALAITKVGSSTTILLGTNKYFGATTVSAGTLQVGNGGILGQLGSGPIVNNAALVYNRSDAVTISNAISGSGNLSLQGGIVATFQGTNTSSGTLVVAAGAADVGVAGSIQCPISLAAGTYLIVTNNPVFTLNQTLSGVGTVDGGLTAVGGTISPAGTGAGGTLSFLNNLTNTGPVAYQMELATAGATDLVSVTGDLVVTATNSIIASKLGGGTLANGTYPLINYSGSFVGGLTNFTVTVSGVTATLTNPPNQIALIITPGVRGATNLTWVGDGAANFWDDNISTNWVNGVAQFKFLAGDSVRFDAAGAANPTVTLNSAVLQPAAVVVNAANDYTFTGIGSISGATGLTKTNTGMLTIQTTNGYSGPTVIGGGILAISSVANGNFPSAIGASSSNPTNLVFHGTTLSYIGSDGATDHGATLNGLGGTFDVPSVNLTFNGSQIVGPGSLTKAGAGTLTLSVPNTYAGGTVISNGVLALGSNSANNDGVGGSGLGATANPVTFRGGTLQLFGYSGGTGNNYSTLFNPLIVPVGQVGTLRMFPRGPVNSGAAGGLQSSLTGGGTLNLVVNYVRDDLSGDWSAFTGLINVTAKSGADEMRINNNFSYTNATINLNDGVILNRSFTANTVNDIGALDGTSLAVVGPGNSSGLNPTWRVGWKNTDATFAGTIANDGSTTVIKVGSGKWTLSGFNLYTGPTTISNGVLELTGSLASTNIAVAAGAFLDVSTLVNLPLGAGQTLSGNGTVRGGVDTSAGGTIAPGFSIGTLTATNAVTLGGNVVMEVNRSGFVSDKLDAPTIACGGTLTVVNTGSALQIGDTFDLFNGTLSGGFSTLTLGYYTWNTTQLAPGGNGTITVTGFLPPPTLTVTSTGTDIILNAAGGVPGGALSVVTSTNIATPLDAWTTVQNGVFDGSGNYTLTIPIDSATAQRLYAIRAF